MIVRDFGFWIGLPIFPRRAGLCMIVQVFESRKFDDGGVQGSGRRGGFIENEEGGAETNGVRSGFISHQCGDDAESFFGVGCGAFVPEGGVIVPGLG